MWIALTHLSWGKQGWEAGISEENVTQEWAEEPESPPLKPDFFFLFFKSLVLRNDM